MVRWHRLWRGLGCALLLSISTCTGDLWAQSHDVLLGGRTATMGGAGTAAGNDSAMPFLNPAGMAGIPGDVFAVSASVYGYSRREVPKFFLPGGLASSYGSWSQSSKLRSSHVIDLPSSVMYFVHIGEPDDEVHHVTGMSLVIPLAGQADFIGRNTVAAPLGGVTIDEQVNLTASTRDYYMGPSYAISFDNRLRIGVSAYVLYTESIMNFSYTNSTLIAHGALPMSQRASLGIDRRSVSLSPIAGAQLELTPNLWLGAGVAAPTLHLSGRSEANVENAGAATDPSTLRPTTFSSIGTSTGDYRSERPLRINAGIAHDDRESFSIAADFTWYAKRVGAQEVDGTQSWVMVASGETSRRYTKQIHRERSLAETFDLAAGVEFAITDVLSLRAGGFGSRTNRAPLDPALDELYTIREDRYGGTLGAGIRLGSFDTTAGVAYTRTDGKILVYDQLSEAALGASQRGEVYWPSVSTTSDTVMLILSAAVTSEEAKRTIEEYAPIRMPALPQSTLPMGAPREGGAPGISPGVIPPRWQAPPSPTVPPAGQHRPGLAPAPGDAPPRSPVLDGAANPSGGPQ